MSGSVEAAGHAMEVSRPDKVLFPDDGLTKADLVRYYLRVADRMLPHVEGRPVAMKRYPGGIGAHGFFEKKAPKHFPGWIRRATVPREGGGTITQVLIEDAATLGYLANQACVTPHVWLSRVDRPHQPDQIMFDLDPAGDDDFDVVCEGAKALRALLDEVGLMAFVKTTGSRGLHVVAPLRRGPDFDEVREVAARIARRLAETDDRFTVETRKQKRRGRVFVDWLRNGYAQHAAAPYAVRPRPGAPVATPVDWDEVGAGLGPRRYGVRNLFRRLGQKDDPWAAFWRHRHGLGEARRALGVR